MFYELAQIVYYQTVNGESPITFYFPQILCLIGVLGNLRNEGCSCIARVSNGATSPPFGDEMNS